MENRVDFFQFKKLLKDLETKDVLIRFRPSGQTWTKFSKILIVSENALIMQEGTKQTIIMNLKNVVEFEVDQPYSDFDASNLYRIDPD